MTTRLFANAGIATESALCRILTIAGYVVGADILNDAKKVPNDRLHPPHTRFDHLQSGYCLDHVEEVVMLLTTEQAKTRWCPHARIDSTASNRPNAGDNCATTAGWPPCIGGACMAWRLDYEGYEEALARHDDAANMGGPAGLELERELPTPMGYCGLAGKP